ncbi:MAG: hypothetical protein ACK5H2_01885 [Beutenbergiaceae bacterium]
MPRPFASLARNAPIFVLKDRTDTSRDVEVCFEDTGIDYVIVDEMHMYNNLATESNIRDAAIDGSDRATDLHMKLEYLRSQGRERVVTGATGTPISNSVTEAFVMQRYLRPDLLEAAGIGAFDAWAATFGQTITQMEMAPTGNNTFRMKTRFAKFTNVPEMLTMWLIFADVKTAEDLQLPPPTSPHATTACAHQRRSRCNPQSNSNTSSSSWASGPRRLRRKRCHRPRTTC